MTIIEDMARFAAELSLDDVPAEVLALCRAQRRSVVASIAATLHDDAAERVLMAVDAHADPGPVPLWGRPGRRVRVDDALLAATALSIALDYDDYLLFGHTGHAAVLVPMLLAYELEIDGRTQLKAQVVANELGARLGAACIFGPVNGQMWSFVNAIGAAVAAGIVMGLDERRLAHAIGIVLYQAPRPTVPGFMAPDSKLLTAADPTLAGLRAARFAAAGVTGPLDVLDQATGFLEAFAYTPMRVLLGGLQSGWATRTLSIKPYPACAYVDTTIDALLSLPRLDPREIVRVEVAAGILTIGMNGLSHAYAHHGLPTPVTVCFSTAWNVAILLLAGRLTSDEVNAAWLHRNLETLQSLVSRVTIHHEWALTQRTLDSMITVISPREVLLPLGFWALWDGLSRMRRDHGRVELGIRDAFAFARYVLTTDTSGYEPWNDAALQRFRMSFPARVRVLTTSGKEYEAEVNEPAGGAGNRGQGPLAVAEEKWKRHAELLLGAHCGAFEKAIETDQRLPDV